MGTSLQVVLSKLPRWSASRPLPSAHLEDLLHLVAGQDALQLLALQQLGLQLSPRAGRAGLRVQWASVMSEEAV